jgi:hypothetical protein
VRSRHGPGIVQHLTTRQLQIKDRLHHDSWPRHRRPAISAPDTRSCRCLPACAAAWRNSRAQTETIAGAKASWPLNPTICLGVRRGGLSGRWKGRCRVAGTATLGWLRVENGEIRVSDRFVLRDTDFPLRDGGLARLGVSGKSERTNHLP